MKRFKNFVLAVFIALSFFAAANVQAVDRSDPGHEKFQKIWGQLNLTPAQKKQLEENKIKHMEARKAEFEKMRSCMDSLKAELMKPELDMKKINIIQAELKTLHAKAQDGRLASILEVRKILTLEQFKKFNDLTEKRGFRPPH